MKVYSFPTFNLTKILLTAEEAGEEYSLELLDLSKAEHKSDEHVKRHPLGKVPAVEIDGEFYIESNAICRLIAERQGGELYGETPEERAKVSQWMDMMALHLGRWLSVPFFEETLKPTLLGGETSREAVEEAAIFLGQQLPVLEKQLECHAYIAGDKFTIADIVAFSYFETVDYSSVDLRFLPKIRAWRESIKSRPSYARAMSHLPGNRMFAVLDDKAA